MIARKDIQARRDEIVSIGKRQGASNFRIFGSIARGDATEASDVDFLVMLEPGRSLLDQGGLLMVLRDLLGVEVDLLEDDQLTGRFGQIVRKEAIAL